MSRLDPHKPQGASPLLQQHTLRSGRRVRLRLAHFREGDEVRALLHRIGDEPTELGLQALLRADPRRRLVLCATSWDGLRERVVGIGAIDIRAAPEPDLLAIEPDLADELGPLMRDVLIGRARYLAQRAA